MKLATRTKGYLLDTDFFDNTFKEFTCVSCGKVEFYSDRLNFTKIKNKFLEKNLTKIKFK